jgi:hypothetical protein
MIAVRSTGISIRVPKSSEGNARYLLDVTLIAV